MRQMVMVGFLQAQNCTNLVSSWRHPESRDDTTSADYYQTIGRVLEAGKFHVGFFDDRLAMPDRYGNDHRHTVEHGIRCVKLDPVTVLTVMGMATSRLGLGATCSTTYFEPFHVARVFATLDLMTGGRAAWNVVTSMNDGEALNMGLDRHMEHDSRYDRADEFMDVVVGHWNSWDDDAIVLDKRSGRFADPDKVRRLDHVGKWFRSRGPFTVPRSPQGQPVVIQAGQSGRGKQFAARWGELVFVTTHTSMEHGKQVYREMKDDIAREGRNPDHVAITPSTYVVAAATRAEAEDKMALIDKLATDEDALSLLSEAMNFDFASKGLDEPFSDEELAGISGTQSMRDRVLRASGISNPTPRDFVRYSSRARPNQPIVGGPKEVADGLEERFTAPVADGFVLAATHVPGTYVDFVQWVVPELQRRGLYHKDYTSATLRENLGIPIPRAISQARA
ncbi:MAG TPA: LLM class flavin-dependent oxidoreductase [Acetobacteraceae bacterium]|nr:LLM class flavin-dependent oxidoreductase [Acetobacteraceae bacterium]